MRFAHATVRASFPSASNQTQMRVSLHDAFLLSLIVVASATNSSLLLQHPRCRRNPQRHYCGGSTRVYCSFQAVICDISDPGLAWLGILGLRKLIFFPLSFFLVLALPRLVGNRKVDL